MLKHGIAMQHYHNKGWILLMVLVILQMVTLMSLYSMSNAVLFMKSSREKLQAEIVDIQAKKSHSYQVGPAGK